MSERKPTRRQFLNTTKRALQGAAGAAVLRPWLGRVRAAELQPANHVFSAYHENLVTGTTEDTVDFDWVRAGVDACVRAMADTISVDEAWQTIFPGISTSSKIAIKVNCLNTDVHPQWATVRALIESMTSMFSGGFPAGNISLFDNNLWTNGKVDACYGSSELDALGIAHAEDTYAGGDTVSVGGTTMYASKYWSDADYGISLAKMSPHQYYAGGLSGVIKNMMGAVSLNNNSSYSAKQNNNGFHDTSPYTAWRDYFSNYAAAHLQLYIVDMLFACRHENESGWARVVKRITMGRDPAAVDSYNVDAINDLGMNVVKTVTKDVPAALEAAGVGTTSYTLVEPVVTLDTVAPSRADLDRAVRNAREGSASEAEVREQILRYREQ